MPALRGLLFALKMFSPRQIPRLTCFLQGIAFEFTGKWVEHLSNVTCLPCCRLRLNGKKYVVNLPGTTCTPSVYDQVVLLNYVHVYKCSRKQTYYQTDSIRKHAQQPPTCPVFKNTGMHFIHGRRNTVELYSSSHFLCSTGSEGDFSPYLIELATLYIKSHVPSVKLPIWD